MSINSTISIKVQHITSKQNLLKIRYGWSKHGGGRNVGVVEVNLPEWTCQSCGQKQVKGMPFFEVPFEDINTEFIKICGDCEHKRIVNNLLHVHDLLVHLARL